MRFLSDKKEHVIVQKSLATLGYDGGIDVIRVMPSILC